MDARDPNPSAEALLDRIRRLETAVDATGLGVWEWDVRSGALMWNARNYELFGVEAGRPLTIQDYAPLVHPDDREIVRNTWREVSEKPEGGDFSMEHRTAFAPEGKARWVVTRGRVIKDSHGVVLVVGSTLDITDRRTAEERRSLVLRELAHRAKNGILIMMAIVAQTARSAGSVGEFEKLVTARLQSMADSQDLVTQAAGRSLPMGDLLDRALQPFDPERFEVEPALRTLNVKSEMVVAMALLLHELSTNAVKYGALSRPTGHVRLTLEHHAEGRAVVVWRETGGPEVRPLARTGFGMRLLEISLRNSGGHVEAIWDPKGFCARIAFPPGRP